jgi:NADH dehydrogenase FAD-containing subunit
MTIGRFSPSASKQLKTHRNPAAHFCAFEAAERETDAVQLNALLTFVIVGGGPTAELAGALGEIANLRSMTQY